MKYILNDRVFNKILILGLLAYAALPLLPATLFMYAVLITGVIISFIALLAKTPKRDYYFIIFKPLIFTFLILFIVRGLMLFDSRIIKENEKNIVISILVITIISLVFYILKSAFIVMKQTFLKKQVYEMRVRLDILLIFAFLLLPDIVFGIFIYDLIYSFYEVKEGVISDWDQIYFSLSQHFLLEHSSASEKIAKSLIIDPIGQVSMAAHALLNKVMDLTVITLVVNMFLTRFLK